LKVSKKSDYALRAMVTLAEDPNSLYPIRVLAEMNDIPKRFLEHIMLDLKNAGFVVGISGRDGGYCLAKHPSEIKVGMILRFFDGMLAPIECVSTRKYEHCTQEKKCKFRRFFLDIRNYTARLMDRISLLELIKMDPVDNSELLIFEDGGGI
jgi:Rrf2 family protein